MLLVTSKCLGGQRLHGMRILQDTSAFQSANQNLWELLSDYDYQKDVAGL